MIHICTAFFTIVLVALSLKTQLRFILRGITAALESFVKSASQCAGGKPSRCGQRTRDMKVNAEFVFVACSGEGGGQRHQAGHSQEDNFRKQPGFMASPLN